MAIEIKIQGIVNGLKSLPVDSDTLEIQETANGNSYYITITGLKDNFEAGTMAITGAWNFQDSGLGGFSDYDMSVGSTNYGMARFGTASFGRTSRNTANLDLDGTVVLINNAIPATSNILFAMMDGSNSMRFALPKSAVGNATYNPRSMLCAGPAPNDDEAVTVGYWQTQGIFHNLDCDTGTDGADLGVQNDIEVEGDVFTDSIKESTPAAGVTIDGLVVKDGAIPATAVERTLIVAVSDETTALTAGVDKLTFRMDAFTLTGVRASLNTAPTGSTLIVDINESGTSVLSTKLSIDATETTSTTAAVAAVISDSVIADDAEISIDIDQIGSTIAGAGLKIYLTGYLT